MLVAFHSTLSDESIHFRYFSQLPLKTRIAHERLVRICFADYDCENPARGRTSARPQPRTHWGLDV
jgi:acetyltransferase